MLIETSAPKVDRSISVEYDFGGTLDKAMDLFGDTVVYSNFEDNAVIGLQGLVRRCLEKKDDKYMSDDEIRAVVANHVPGVGAKRGDPLAALMAKFQKLSPEKQEEMIRKLKGE